MTAMLIVGYTTSSPKVYEGKLETVCLYDKETDTKISFPLRTSKAPVLPTLPKRAKYQLPLQVAATILELWPDSFSDDPFDAKGRPDVTIVGFEPKAFLKFLGLECAALGYPLPGTLWYGNSDHRDLWEAMLPASVSKGITGDTALSTLGLGDWLGYEIGSNAEQDVQLAAELTKKLGLWSGSSELIRSI